VVSRPLDWPLALADSDATRLITVENRVSPPISKCDNSGLAKGAGWLVIAKIALANRERGTSSE